jgi:hypothetical protein
MSIWKIRGLFVESSNSQMTQVATKKLEFYLQIYFATYPLNPMRTNNSRLFSHEMMLFKHYLETIAAHDPLISQTSEFITYYALPYVPNPLEHKSFKHLFTREYL